MTGQGSLIFQLSIIPSPIWQITKLPLTARLNSEISAPQSHLQNNLHVVRIPFALLVAPELGAAVQQRGDNTGLLGVYRWRRDKRGRGCEGRGRGVAEVSSGYRHGSRFAGWTPTAGNCRLSAGLGRRLRRDGGGLKRSTTIQFPPDSSTV